ncbi:MAG: hypothetical protein WD066_11730 [Planctomycetaceae bacterium]
MRDELPNKAAHNLGGKVARPARPIHEVRAEIPNLISENHLRPDWPAAEKIPPRAKDSLNPM